MSRAPDQITKDAGRSTFGSYAIVGFCHTLEHVTSDERIPITVRLSKAGLAEIDKMAEDEERDRSSMIRLLLKEAVETRKKRRPRR